MKKDEILLICIVGGMVAVAWIAVAKTVWELIINNY